MIIPSKFISLDDSIIGKSVSIFTELSKSKNIIDQHSKELIDKIGINDFLLCIDLLWLTDKLEVNEVSGEISHAK